MRHGRHSLPSPLARATALLAVLLVLILAVLSASPELHERLHSHDAAAVPAHSGNADAPCAADTEAGCVVTLFSHGLVLALLFFALIASGVAPRLVRTPDSDAFLAPDPAYLHLPQQAPPLAAG